VDRFDSTPSEQAAMDTAIGEDTPAFGDFEDLETGTKFQTTQDGDDDPEAEERKRKKLELKEQFNSEYDEVCI